MNAVTGSSSGLGLEAARHFARLKARKVILAVRSVAKGEVAKASIEASSGCKPGVVEVWNLDLTSYDSVKAFANEVEKLPRVDAIIENAGIQTQVFKLAENHERTITTNVVSTFLLALLLLPKLRKSAVKFNITPVLNIVTSEVHYFAKRKHSRCTAQKSPATLTSTLVPERQSSSIFEALRDEKTAQMKQRCVLT